MIVNKTYVLLTVLKVAMSEIKVLADVVELSFRDDTLGLCP